MSLPDLIIIAILILIVGGIVTSVIIRKKRGEKPFACGSCASCGSNKDNSCPYSNVSDSPVNKTNQDSLK